VYLYIVIIGDETTRLECKLERLELHLILKRSAAPGRNASSPTLTSMSNCAVLAQTNRDHTFMLTKVVEFAII